VTQSILRQRLKRATSSLSSDYRLILECYHPAAALSTPYLFCNYLHTDIVDGGYLCEPVDEDAPSISPEPHDWSLSRHRIENIYSHFRPVVQQENRSGRVRYPRRPQQQQQSNRAQQEERLEEKHPYQDIELGLGELFSQLCTVTNLVRLRPRPGLFLTHVNVSDNVIRVERDWLAAQAKADESRILWVDEKYTVGLRFRVEERDVRDQHPILAAADEELPAVYRLEFEELLVRAGTILLMVEKSEVQRDSATEGNAVVIAFDG